MEYVLEYPYQSNIKRCHPRVQLFVIYEDAKVCRIVLKSERNFFYSIINGLPMVTSMLHGKEYDL